MERTETTELINNPGDSWGENRQPYKSGSRESVDQDFARRSPEQLSDWAMWLEKE